MEGKPPLILDIGTEAVKAGFLKKTAVQYYNKFGVFVDKDFNKEIIKKAVLKAIDEVKDNDAFQPKHVLLALPVDILKAKTAFYFLERKDPEKIISKKEEREIQQELFKKSRAEIKDIFSQEFGVDSQELDFLEESFLETNIDGYSVPLLAGYKGKRIGSQIFSVFALRTHFKKFRQLFKELNLTELKIVHPGQYLPKLFKNIDEGFFLDVGGEATQAYIVKKGKLAELFDFPAGGVSFSRALSQTFGLSEEKARIFKESYAKKEMEEKATERIHEIFSGISEAWFFQLKEKLKAATGLLPSDIFIFGGAGQLPEIKEILENLREEKSPQILKNPQLVNLNLLSYAKQK